MTEKQEPYGNETDDNLTYEQKVEKLDEILTRLDNSETPIDKLAEDVKRASGLPLVFLSAKENVLKDINLAFASCPILPLTRSMLKPWERSETGENS